MEIIFGVDLCNLNRASKKDYYLIPLMEQILQLISISKVFSLSDGLSIYNQVLLSNEDKLITTFRTKWENFSYKRMPFGLINVGKILIELWIYPLWD